MLSKRLIVLSLDAVSSEDIKVLSTLPHLKKLLAKGSLIENVKTIYPSLTYPAHATMITGQYPSHHGIINNTHLEPNHDNPSWFWYHKSIKCPTLFDLAHKKGLTTCSILWPVTARAPITYNLPEIFPTKKWHNQLLMSGLAGSLSYQLKLQQHFGHIRQGTSQPALDDFVLECTKYTLLNYKPHALFVHMTDVDTNRHYTGHSSLASHSALLRHDKRLGEIIETLKSADIYDETTFVILGDHAQLPVHSILKVNKIFADHGLIQLNSKGKILSYTAIAKSCDGACYIYLKDPTDSSLLNKIKQLLKTISEQDASPIEGIFDNKEAIQLGADPKCSFMLEAREGYYFIDTPLGEFIEPIDTNKVGHVPHYLLSSHGYLPTKPNYTTFFLAVGPDIKENYIQKNGHLINHAPTFAHLLGLSLKDTDGHIEWSIFKEREKTI